MSDLEDIYVAEPRLNALESLMDAVARRDGVVPEMT